MLILVTYDVDTVSETGQKRLRMVARVCKDYGLRVQNSVFECDVTEVQFIKMKNDIASIIDKKLDSVRFYHLNKHQNGKVESLGKKTGYNVNEVIII